MSSENKTIKNKISILFNYYNIKNYDKLIEEANRLLKKNPNIDILWNMLGLTYQQLGEFNKAEKNFLKTLQINPVNISAVNNLGNNYKYLDDFQNAIKDTKIKDELKTLTQKAHDIEIFGAPTFVVNNKIFWGQDRLEFALNEYNE